MNAALFYLRRYSASEKRLRQVLRRKALRCAKAIDGSAQEAELLVEIVVKRVVRLGYIDDARLAVGKTASLRRQGKSTRAIAASLRSKGLSMPPSAEQGSDDDAVWAFAKKRRLGPYARAPVDVEGRRKALAMLARAGYRFDLAKRVVDAKERPE